MYIKDIPSDKFKEIVLTSESVQDALRKCELSCIGGGARQTFFKRCEKEKLLMELNELKIRGFETAKQKAKIAGNQQNIPAEQILVENCQHVRAVLVRYLNRTNLIKKECAWCGLINSWNGKPLSLQIDHINGVGNDNRIENLRWLCPNCHSQTETWAAKKNKKERPKCVDCGKIINLRSIRCQKCFSNINVQLSTNINDTLHKPKINWPSKEELEKLVWEKPRLQIAKELGVSINAVIGYCKRRNIEQPGPGYWRKKETGKL